MVACETTGEAVPVGGGGLGDDEVGDGLGDVEVGDGLGDGEVGDGEVGDGEVGDGEVGDGEVEVDDELGCDDVELEWYGAGDVLTEEHDEGPGACCDPPGSMPMTLLEVWPSPIGWLTPGAGMGGIPATELCCAPFPAVPACVAHPVDPLADGLPDVVFPAVVELNPLELLDWGLPPPDVPGPPCLPCVAVWFSEAIVAPTVSRSRGIASVTARTRSRAPVAATIGRNHTLGVRRFLAARPGSRLAALRAGVRRELPSERAVNSLPARHSAPNNCRGR